VWFLLFGTCNRLVFPVDRNLDAAARGLRKPSDKIVAEHRRAPSVDVLACRDLSVDVADERDAAQRIWFTRLFENGWSVEVNGSVGPRRTLNDIAAVITGIPAQEFHTTIDAKLFSTDKARLLQIVAAATNEPDAMVADSLRPPTWRHQGDYIAAATVEFYGPGASEFYGCAAAQRYRVPRGHTLVAINFCPRTLTPC
jgi:hypothetical protein